MIEHYGSDELVKEVLLHMALDSIATSRRLCPPPLTPDEPQEAKHLSAEEILTNALRPYSLRVRQYFEGRPSTLVLSAASGVVAIGEEPENIVEVGESPVAAKLSILKHRTRGAAVFSIGLDDFEGADSKYQLAFFVLCSEERVLVVTKAELMMMDAHLRTQPASTHVGRFSRGPGNRLRFSLPKTGTGLDLTTRVSARLG